MAKWLRRGAVAAIAVASLLVPAAAPSATDTVAAEATVSLSASRFGKGAAETRPARIVVANADGGGARVLTTGWTSSVSPSGSQVAVVDSDRNWWTNQRLELYASAGGAPTRVMKAGCVHVAWSPDSTKLACVEVTGSDRSTRLLLVDPSTGALTTLAKGFFDTQVAFSPDSADLAYVQKSTSAFVDARSTLKVIDLATRSVRTLRSGGVASPAWGPTEIAFAVLKPRGRDVTLDAAAIRPDGTGFRRLTAFRPDQQLFGPLPVAWSADGKRLLAGVFGRDAWTGREAYAIDPVRGGLRLIAHQVSPSALSRDGRFVIGQTGDAATTGLAGSNVVRVPWGGGAKRVLLRQAVEPSFNG